MIIMLYRYHCIAFFVELLWKEEKIMKKINKGIVFSNDIKRIIGGINAFDYKYDAIPRDQVFDTLRDDFELETNKKFNGGAVIISEEEMLQVNKLIRGDYPHCYVG